jgi:hypothetical protein
MNESYMNAVRATKTRQGSQFSLSCSLMMINRPGGGLSFSFFVDGDVAVTLYVRSIILLRESDSIGY